MVGEFVRSLVLRISCACRSQFGYCRPVVRFRTRVLPPLLVPSCTVCLEHRTTRQFSHRSDCGTCVGVHVRRRRRKKSSRMPTTCGFPNCRFRSRYRGAEDNRHFYRVPKKPAVLRKRWLEAIGRTEETIVSQLRVCSGHFHGGEKHEGDIPVADPTVDELIRIELPPKTPRLQSTVSASRLGLRGSRGRGGGAGAGTGHGTTATNRAKMSLLRPGMLNYLSKGAYSLLNHKPKSGLATNYAYLSQPNSHTTQTKWLRAVSSVAGPDRTNQTDELVNNPLHSARRTRDDSVNSFPTPLPSLTSGALTKQSGTNGALHPPNPFHVPFPTFTDNPTLWPPNVAHLTSSLAHANFPLGPEKPRPTSPTTWSHSSPVHPSQLSAFANQTSHRKTMPDLNLAWHSHPHHAQPKPGVRVSRSDQSRSTQSIPFSEPTSLSEYSTPWLNAFTNLFSANMDMTYYNQILASMLTSWSEQNAFPTVALGSRKKSGEPHNLFHPLSPPLSSISSASTSSSLTAATATPFPPPFPAMSDSWSSHFNLTAQKTTNQSNSGHLPGPTDATLSSGPLLNLSMDALGRSRMTPIIKSAQANLPRPYHQPSRELFHPSERYDFTFEPSRKRAAVETTGITCQLPTLDDSILDKLKPHSTDMTHSTDDYSKPTVLFVGGYEDVAMETLILQEFFQVRCIADVNDFANKELADPLYESVTALVIPPDAVGYHVDRCIVQFKYLQRIYLPGSSQTTVDYLRKQFPALEIHPVRNPINVDLAADFVMTLLLLAQTGAFELHNVCETDRSTASQPIGLTQRPRSLPSANVTHPSEDRLDQGCDNERVAWGSETACYYGKSSPRQPWNCGTNVVKPRSLNRSSERGTLQGKAVGLLQWNSLTLAVARRLQPFGCKLLVSDEDLPQGVDHVFGVTRVPNRTQLLAQSDCLLVLDECGQPDRMSHAFQTVERTMDVEVLRQMKPGCHVIYLGTPENTARLPSESVLRALKSGTIGRLIATFGLVQRPSPALLSHPAVLWLRETTHTFKLSSMEFRAHVARHIRRLCIQQRDCTSAIARPTGCRIDPVRAEVQSAVNGLVAAKRSSAVRSPPGNESINLTETVFNLGRTKQAESFKRAAGTIGLSDQMEKSSVAETVKQKSSPTTKPITFCVTSLMSSTQPATQTTISSRPHSLVRTEPFEHIQNECSTAEFGAIPRHVSI